MTHSNPTYIPPNRQLEPISRRMHPIANISGWGIEMFGARWRFSIPMDASTTSNGLSLDCERRPLCNCAGTASINLTDGFTRLRFRSLGYSTLGQTRFAGRVSGYPCRCVVTVPRFWWSLFCRRTMDSTIACVSGNVRKVEIKRPSQGTIKTLGAYRVDEKGGWKNYSLVHKQSRDIVRMLPPEPTRPEDKCVVCDWLFAGSLLCVCIYSETVWKADV